MVRKKKDMVENIVFLSAVFIILIIGLFFLFESFFSLINYKNNSVVMPAALFIPEKVLDARLLKTEKVRQLVAYPREQFDINKVRAGGKRCPFGGLQ